jgi:hypothetical protein
MKKDITVGMDMGDKSHSVCVLDADGQIVERATITNTARAIRKYFTRKGPCLVAIEAGTHSGWVSRVLEELGNEVLVGNPRKLRVIWDSDEKDDERDAEMLARIARFDPGLIRRSPGESKPTTRSPRRPIFADSGQSETDQRACAGCPLRSSRTGYVSGWEAVSSSPTRISYSDSDRRSFAQAGQIGFPR